MRRIVRQTSKELGKEVELVINNAEGEIDRTIMEHMVAPLEHMVRNSLDHGIESKEERLAAGKPEVGRITLTIRRDTGEVVVALADDGRGISVDAVRKKAIEKGLLAPNEEVSDNQVLRFIMESGFSTAAKVTQLSGRGVGMDAVSYTHLTLPTICSV